MDLLASLHLDVLPEQQTRTSHPSVSAALDSNPDIRLGFDHCCHCAKPLQSAADDESSKKKSNAGAKPYYCKGCRRVAYCSPECRAADASASKNEDDDSEGGGHGSVVCALLRLCDKDEAIDEGDTNKKKSANEDEEARDRVRSEFESYPATLANVLSNLLCYQSALAARRGQALNVHIVGASEGVELWGDYRPAKGEPSVREAYADALSDLADSNKLSININFVGPDCPKKKMDALDKLGTIEMGGKQMQTCLVMESHRSNYDKKFLSEPPSGGFGRGPLSAPDVVVFFNPGFTCPDYNWDGALACIKSGTPFLVTTNTEMEGIADCQYLYEKGFISWLPPMIRDIIEGSDREDEDSDMDDEESNMFFGENPFAGSRVRQSGNMANDLFVKNRTIFGGIFGSEPKKATTGTKRKEGSVDERSPKKKKNKESKKSKGNTKRSNRALI